MRRFKSPEQAQRFLGAHAAVYNLFDLGRHLVTAKDYRNLREGAFLVWNSWLHENGSHCAAELKS